MRVLLSHRATFGRISKWTKISYRPMPVNPSSSALSAIRSRASGSIGCGRWGDLTDGTISVANIICWDLPAPPIASLCFGDRKPEVIRNGASHQSRNSCRVRIWDQKRVSGLNPDSTSSQEKLGISSRSCNKCLLFRKNIYNRFTFDKFIERTIYLIASDQPDGVRVSTE